MPGETIYVGLIKPVSYARPAEFSVYHEDSERTFQSPMLSREGLVGYLIGASALRDIGDLSIVNDIHPEVALRLGSLRRVVSKVPPIMFSSILEESGLEHRAVEPELV